MNTDEIKDPVEDQEIKIGEETESTEEVVIISEEVKETVVEVEEEIEAEKISLEEIIEVEETKSAHDDYDWSIGKKHSLTYEQAEIDKYLKDYDQSLTKLQEFSIVKGKVRAMTPSDIVLDINYKSDGLVSASEFRDMPELAIGDEVEVYVLI